jgi:1,4-dihydroxy-2-naphthoyl-CoA synthase
MTQGFQTLQIDVRAGVAVVTMARERVRNAFNEAMIEELDSAFDELGAESAVRAIVWPRAVRCSARVRTWNGWAAWPISLRRKITVMR